MYRVEIDWAPAYELLVSLEAFCSRSEQRLLELGTGWVTRVRRDLDPGLLAELSSPDSLAHFDLLDLLIRQCPVDRDADSFTRWLASLSVGELYERVAPHMLEGVRVVPRDLGSVRDRHVRILTGWNEQYFRCVDPAVLAGLEADAESKRALAGEMDPVRLVELATTGVEFLPQPEPEVVLLIPQYHFRPWNLFGAYYGVRRISYPADPIPPAAGEPSPSLLRLTRALSDESRLRILRFLADGPSSFTAIVQFIGLAKSTVHHHMVALRAAGLVRVHEVGDKTTYSLRPEALDDLGDRLCGYLTAGEASRIEGGHP